MFDSLSRSWSLTRLSWRVLNDDKEMLLFPLLGGLFSLLYGAAILWPTLLSGVFVEVSGGSAELPSEAILYGALFVTYFGLSFIGTFFSVCTVYTTKVRLDGGDATFMESIRFALSRLPAIAAWSLVSASVGVLLRSLERAAERLGIIGSILVGILTSLLGLAWTVTTLFVVPAMVYHDEGPIDAIKTSVDVLKKTWGESLARHVGLGWVQGLVTFLGFVLFMPAIFLTLNTPQVAAGIAALFFVFLIGVALVFVVMNSVFNTALFVYAQTGECPGEWDDDLLQGAFANQS